MKNSGPILFLVAVIVLAALVIGNATGLIDPFRFGTTEILIAILIVIVCIIKALMHFFEGRGK